MIIIEGVREELFVEIWIDPNAITTGDATNEDFFYKNFGPG